MDTYIIYDVDHNKKHLKFKVDCYTRILKHKTIFVKGYATDWYEEIFVVKKVKVTITVPYQS